MEAVHTQMPRTGAPASDAAAPSWARPWLPLAMLEDVWPDAASASRRLLPAGSTLLAQGSRADELYIVARGFVVEEHLTRTGRRVILHVRGPGDLIGETCLLDREPYRASALVLEDAEVLVVPGARVRHEMRTAGPLGAQILDTLLLAVRSADTTIVDLATAPAIVRVARRILQLADRWGRDLGDSVVIPVPLTQEDLAAWAGLSHQATVKALATLRARGIIATGRRQLQVLDLPALRARADR